MKDMYFQVSMNYDIINWLRIILIYWINSFKGCEIEFGLLIIKCHTII